MSNSDATRTSLLTRARHHDSQAWHELVDLYGPLIAHWCYRCGLSSQQAADCVQEVFAAVARSLVAYEPKKAAGAFRAWLWTITSNKIKDLYRRNRHQATAAGGSTALAMLEQQPDPAALPEYEPSGENQVAALVSRGVAQIRQEFEPRTWEIFHRAVVDQIPTAIVAEEFSITPAAVRQVRSRVLRRLRQQLGDLED